jgi:IPT/TIG domain
MIKQCPQCNRTYDNEIFSFCLDDGALLSAPYDPDATLIINPSLPKERIVKPSPPKGRKTLYVTSAKPESVIAGGTIVTFRGGGLDTINKVHVEGSPVVFAIISANEIKATVPPHIKGLAHVVLFSLTDHATAVVQL